MSHDRARRGHSERVSLARRHEIRDWSRELECTPAELRAAVRAVGRSVGAVRLYLARARAARASRRVVYRGGAAAHS
ncbi:MAG TPA: DUF3606 domain-containing protein [Nevskiaceae bacterium]|nr:DUF3606 domain-containing protein [Nevskiaceae bacterium]